MHEAHPCSLWLLNRWPVCSLFHNATNFEVTRNIIIKGVHVKKIGAQIEVECCAKGQGEGYGMSHAGQG